MSLPEYLESPKDHCGIVAIANHPKAAKYIRLALFSLQHRGQESAGISICQEDGHCDLHKGMGLVNDVFRRLPKKWIDISPHMAIGHVRYSTAGDSSLVNAQPFAVEFDRWQLALAHNGHLSNSNSIRTKLKKSGTILQGNTDTELMIHLAALKQQRGQPPWQALQEALHECEGAFSIVAICQDGLAVARDPYGFRPFAIGRFNGTFIAASETSAFDLIGAEYIRDVQPGEFIHVKMDGSMHSSTFNKSSRKAHCIFELVYFSRPDSRIFGEQVYQIRRRLGACLASEAPVNADVIMPIPDSGLYAALGFSQASKIPFDMGLMRNHYIGRTFIHPNESDRQAAVKIKLNPIRDAINGKRVCLIDDSIVRGNTSKEHVHMLRSCGAKEVHMRISCPPHISPCYFGINFPKADELIANHYSINEIARKLKLDSLAYLSLEGMLSCVKETKATDYCHACYSKEYPITLKNIDGVPQSMH